MVGPIERPSDTDSIFGLYRMIQQSISRSDFYIGRCHIPALFNRSDSLVSRSFFGLKFRLLNRKMVSDSLKQIASLHQRPKIFLGCFFTSPTKNFWNELYHLVFPEKLVYRCHVNRYIFEYRCPPLHIALQS
jgi:hypothetical protein